MNIVFTIYYIFSVDVSKVKDQIKVFSKHKLNKENLVESFC